MDVLDENSSRIITASYALPDFETAVQQVIYNAIDAHAQSIKLSVDIENASLTAVDDGCGISPQNLYTYVGECYASSRLSVSERTYNQYKPYGSRGAFLYELISLAATVEIESRVQEHWTSYRKVFNNGHVIFNARSKHLREVSGTTLHVSKLFGMLPVRMKDLSRNPKYQTRAIRSIKRFCVSMSMIWPSLALDIRFQGERARPMLIPAATSCPERFLEHFGQLLGNQLNYTSYSSKAAEFSIRGYFAFIPRTSETLGQCIKEVKSYYQFAFLDNEWVEGCQQACSRTITEAALIFASAIPIFILKIQAASDQYDVSGIGKKKLVSFKCPEQFQQFLFEFIQKLAENEADRVKCQKSSCSGEPLSAASSDQQNCDPELLYDDVNSSQSVSTSFRDQTKYQELSYGEASLCAASNGQPDYDTHSVLFNSTPPTNSISLPDQIQYQRCNRSGAPLYAAFSDQSIYDPIDIQRDNFNSRQTMLSSSPDYMIANHNFGHDEQHVHTNDWQYDERPGSCVVKLRASKNPSECQACGHVNRASSSLDVNSKLELDEEVHEFSGAAQQMSEVLESNFTFQDNQKDADINQDEEDLEAIFFLHKPTSLLFKPKDNVGNSKAQEVEVSSMPWLSSKPDSCDGLLSLCQEKNYIEDACYLENTNWQSRKSPPMEKLRVDDVASGQSCDNNYASIELQESAVDTTSSYFAVGTDKRSKIKYLTRWVSSKPTSVKQFAAALQVDNVHVLDKTQTIKISRSTLAQMQVICQVDRKFILVQANTSNGKLLLCIDQHAADERVRLEQLEKTIFAHDGSLSQVEVHDHVPPLTLRVNSKEREALEYHEEVVKRWGFEFECISSNREQGLVNVSNRTEFQDNDRVLLHATPKIDKRVSNASDFRDFLQLLSNAGETYLHSQIRPPVITRLLHSRACRSAIMFGDRLSLSQCKDIIEELKMCQFPFQCAHGRPSVVPLAEIRRNN